jgi:hypothetical protein
MVPSKALDKPIDPVELINELLERAWKTISAAYDISSGLPDMWDLLKGTNLSNPEQAAEQVVANMLTEVIDCVCRFSPWYRLPARAFGLISVRDRTTKRVRWTLAPEAIQKWDKILVPMKSAFRKYSGLLQAIKLVDNLMIDGPLDDPCITAFCRCVPPRKIEIYRSILEQAEIVCDLCRHRFTEAFNPDERP